MSDFYSFLYLCSISFLLRISVGVHSVSWISVAVCIPADASTALSISTVVGIGSRPPPQMFLCHLFFKTGTSLRFQIFKNWVRSQYFLLHPDSPISAFFIFDESRKIFSNQDAPLVSMTEFCTAVIEIAEKASLWPINATILDC
jgi:hypothetical protein